MLRPESSYIPKNTPVPPPPLKTSPLGFLSLKESRSERSLHKNRFAQSHAALSERPLNISSSSLKLVNPGMHTRAMNQSPFYRDRLTVINEEEQLFPHNCLTLFDNSGNPAMD